MIKDEFIQLLEEKKYSAKEIDAISIAIDFAHKHLFNIKRLAGDSYFDHNLRTAKILAENSASSDVLVGALLLRIVKYTTQKEVLDKFGKEILILIVKVNEISSVKTRNVSLKAQALRKILLATFSDVRIILIKLADKLDNIKSISYLDTKDQHRIAREVLDIYSPLAYRLGVDRIKTELEDLAFEVINPKKYAQIFKYLTESRQEREKDITTAIAKIKRLTQSKVDILKISGRPKHIFSMFKKMTLRAVPLHEQYDLLGIRIIVPDPKECYIVLGILHENFDPIDGKLKDYIANPKPNGYQSIHTTVLVDGTKWLEIQIRTQEMNEFAEGGLAAHWRYKGLKSEATFEKRMSWLKGVLDLQKEGTDKEFLENVTLDLFADEMYCYTPKGDVKYLKSGSSVLDFAYAIHEEVGNKSVGARVNGKFVPLRTHLTQGDVVEIVTAKNQRPRRNWIKFVVSARAKQKIRKGVKLYQNLPSLHYRIFKPSVRDTHDSLVWSPDNMNASCVLAKCCRPIPKEDIVGIITKRRLISVHGEECRQALKEQERWIPVEWKETFTRKIRLFVDANERSGLLADLLHTIATAKFEVQEAKAKLIGSGRSECSFVIVPQEIDHIEKLVQRIKKVIGVKKIYFE
jgi:GTP diphosphokinase / guanosine-3',5'-bis(diphosphate) 3'-diphosphatase